MDLDAVVPQHGDGGLGDLRVVVIREDIDEIGDAERAIRRPAVIEVRAHGNERLQHSHWRLDV